MYMTKVKAIKSGIAKSKVKMGQIQMGLTGGNMKLVETAASRFLIWSIPAVKTCPWKTPMCEKACYAMKAERIYPSARDRRQSNLDATRLANFVPDMIELIDWELSQNPKNILFRIHESGDFFSLDYLYQWIEITDHFKGNKRIQFLAYTKSIPLVRRAYITYGRDNVNIQFKSSIWDDTKPEMIAMTESLGLTVFTALSAAKFKEKEYSKFFKCPSSASVDKYGCGECAEKYGGCYFANVNTAIEVH